MYFQNKFALLCAFFLLLPQAILAQNAWKSVPLESNGKPLTVQHAIAIPAVAEYKGQKLKAHVFFFGNSLNRHKVPVMGVVIEGLETVVPAKELAWFEGPELEERTIHENAFEISIHKNGVSKAFATPALLDGIYDFPAEIRGKEENQFDSNLNVFQPRILQAWRGYLAAMSSGFEQGQITLGGKLFSAPIVVRFDGQGIEAALPELLKALGN